MTVVFEEREGGESIGGFAADTLSPRSLRNESCHSERREESTSKPLQFVYFSFLISDFHFSFPKEMIFFVVLKFMC